MSVITMQVDSGSRPYRAVTIDIDQESELLPRISVEGVLRECLTLPAFIHWLEDVTGRNKYSYHAWLLHFIQFLICVNGRCKLKLKQPGTFRDRQPWRIFLANQSYALPAWCLEWLEYGGDRFFEPGVDRVGVLYHTKELNNWLQHGMSQESRRALLYSDVLPYQEGIQT